MVAIELPALDLDSTMATDWRLERVSFASPNGPNGVLEFHPRVNVVTVESVAAATSTAALLRAALAAGGEGTHVELTLADGSPMVLFRPIAGRQRFIDVQHCTERPLTDLYDVIDGARTVECENGRGIVDTLSKVDQTTLWAAADQLQAARTAAGQTEAPSAATPTTPGSDGAAPPIDLRRRRGLLRRKVRTDPAGPADTQRQLADAEQLWQRLVGPVSIDVALAHRDRSEAAARLLVRLGALAAVSSAADGLVPAPDRSSVLDAVCELVPLSRPGSGPHIVAVPGSADPDLASLLLDSLAAVSANHQLIVVTADERVIDWAGLEHHAQRCSLIAFGANRARQSPAYSA